MEELDRHGAAERALFFCASRSMPTANADGPCVDLKVPSDGASSNPFAPASVVAPWPSPSACSMIFLKKDALWREEVAPPPTFERLTSFQRILLLKAVRSDRVEPAMAHWVAESMGEKYVFLKKGYDHVSLVFDCGTRSGSCGLRGLRRPADRTTSKT